MLTTLLLFLGFHLILIPHYFLWHRTGRIYNPCGVEIILPKAISMPVDSFMLKIKVNKNLALCRQR